MMNPAPQLSAAAWTLLAILHRHADGGPPAPQSDATYADSHRELLLYGLIERSADQATWVISQLGELALFRHESAAWELTPERMGGGSSEFLESESGVPCTLATRKRTDRRR